MTEVNSTAEDLKFVESWITKLGNEERERLFSMPVVAEQLNKVWKPNPGPQTQAFLSEADELFYGGSAGGGKSELCMGLAVRNHHMSLLLRRTNKEASKFIKRLSEIIGTRDGWNGQTQTFQLADGRIIECGGVQLEEDRQKYKGDPHDLIAFDEITDFTETQFRFISAWNRSARKGQRCRIVCTGNPPTTVEGMWVVRYWGPWLDPTHHNPAKEGELRWYTTSDGDEIEVDGPGPHNVPGEPKPVYAKSRTFIRARLSDNLDLEEQGYDRTLAALPEELRRAYREGRFDVVLQDDAFQVIPSAWIMAAQERWEEDGWQGKQMSAMGFDPAGGGADAAALCWRYSGWFGRIEEIKGPITRDGSAMAAFIVKHRRSEATVIVDAGGGFAGGVIERFKDNGVVFKRFDGSHRSGSRSLGANLQFANMRAEAYWRFREGLDPDQEGGSPISIPPDPQLRAELAAARYTLRSNGVMLDSKDDIRERLGRSPNKADAVVMAWLEGNKGSRRSGGQRRPKAVYAYEKSKASTRRHR